MAVIKESFGPANQLLTCTLTSLANGAYQASASVDNTINLYLDALVFLQIKTASSAVTATGTIAVYAYGSVDGATFTDGMAGTNTVATPSSPPNLRQIGFGAANAVSTTYYLGPFSVAAGFGYLPAQWGLVVLNNTGAAFDGTTAKAVWQGVLGSSL